MKKRRVYLKQTEEYKMLTCSTDQYLALLCLDLIHLIFFVVVANFAHPSCLMAFV